MAKSFVALLMANVAPLSGRLVFAAVFGALILWLVVVPSSRLSEEDVSVVWWKRSRFWAIIVASSQLLIYLLWR